jgi:hypothetical protein
MSRLSHRQSNTTHASRLLWPSEDISIDVLSPRIITWPMYLHCHGSVLSKVAVDDGVVVCLRPIHQVVGDVANTRLTSPMWLGLMMSDCQWVALWGSQWANQSLRLCMCNHVGRLVVRMCGAQGWWSMTEVKGMRARADRSGAVKDECCYMVDGSEQRSDHSWWLIPMTCTHTRTWRSGPCCRRGRGLAGHMSRTWGTHMRCDTHGGLVVWASKPPITTGGGFC